MAKAPRSTSKSTTADSPGGWEKRALVIVESPAKAKTINKYLGSNYIVKSSVGHVRDLPQVVPVRPQKRSQQHEPKLTDAQKAEKAQNALVNRMGVDPEHDWKAHYEVLPGKENVVAELKKLASQVDEVYLTTDLDREGEAIAWHLKEAIGGDDSRYQRVVFNEITKMPFKMHLSIQHAFDIDKVNAQQTRRF